MHEYLLLLHETPGDFADLSPSEMQAIIARYSAWAQEMGQKSLIVAGKKLTDDGGRHLRVGAGSANSPLASDGPYAEAKDVIGGLFIVKAANDAEAEKLAAGCPRLRGRNWLEIRRIDPL